MATASNRSLFVFAHLDGDFSPAGKLDLTEQGNQLVASSFAYGQRYLERPNALEIDPVGLSLRDKSAVRAKLLVPPNGLAFFGGIRDATPDAWGRRVIESRHQVPANSLPESTYLLEAGSERVGALDVRESLTAPASITRGSIHSLSYLMEATERIEAGLPIPESLTEIFVAGSGMGGMRPKVSMRDGGATPRRPVSKPISKSFIAVWCSISCSVTMTTICATMRSYGTSRREAGGSVRCTTSCREPAWPASAFCISALAPRVGLQIWITLMREKNALACWAPMHYASSTRCGESFANGNCILKHLVFLPNRSNGLPPPSGI